MATLTIDRRIAVAAPPDHVWRYLTDPTLVVTCLPGAALVSSSEDGLRHEGTVSVKLGAFNVSYRGNAEFEEVDEQRRRLRVRAKGREKTGAGSADMSMVADVIAVDGGSEVALEASVSVTGKIVALGRGMIEVVSEELLGDFATCLSTRLAGGQDATAGQDTKRSSAVPDDTSGGPSSAPADGLSLLFRALRAWLSRLFKRD